MWADCLAVYGVNIRELSGADAMTLAVRVVDMLPRTMDGEALGSLATEFRWQQFHAEIEKTNYKPDAKEQEVVSDEDIEALERMGQATK